MGGRPAALAALLTEAPQCVPFDHRVQIFRSLVAADKERCASLSPLCQRPSTLSSASN